MVKSVCNGFCFKEYLDLNGAFRAPFEQDDDMSSSGLTSGKSYDNAYMNR